MKRFWRDVDVVDQDGGFTIALDDKAVRTPGKRHLVVPTRSLAEAIAREWAAQGDTVEPAEMPLTRLANSAVDGVAPRRDEVIADAAKYGATDLVCYRAAEPPELVERQRDGWQPLVVWIADRHGIGLEIASGVVPVTQSPETLDTFRALVSTLDDFRLTGFHAVTTACGSLVIALALAEGHVDAEAAWSLSQLDESYQIERWGEDDAAADRRARLRTEIEAAASFMSLAADAG